jgi:aminopeptidase
MTPSIFVETAEKQFAGIDNVTLEGHDLAWAEEKKMGSFISVSRGSDEPLRFLELHYKGAANKDEAPLAFVGKGITFDSGGIVRRCSHLLPCYRSSSDYPHLLLLLI